MYKRITQEGPAETGTAGTASNDTAQFYDAVVDDYHLFYRDWRAASERDGITLRRLFNERGIRAVLDASCGTGTQSIPLAQFGFNVTAADFSAAMLEKAKVNAAKYKVVEKIDYVNASFLDLPGAVRGPFDAVITKGNALPHLLTDAELTAALTNFHDLLRPGGLLLIGMRDFDMILEDRIRFVPGQFHDDPEEQHILFDIWDYADGPPAIITFNKFLVSGSGEEYRVVKHSVKYRALRKTELTEMLTAAGFTDINAENQNWELVFTATRP